MLSRAVPIVVVAALLAACDSDATSTPSPTPTPPASTTSASGAATPPSEAPPPAPASAPDRIELGPAFEGRTFQRPTELGPYPGDRFFLVDQDGLVRLLRPDGSDAGTLLDLQDRVLTSGAEEGFLSLALDPAFPDRPYIYTYYSAGNPRRTVLSRFEVSDDAAHPASELVILEVAQPFSNHNGGAIRFGPDGMLYLGLGDGGGAGDPFGNAQNLGVLLGKILRIDVRDASPEQPYAVPADNPFVGQADARPEIWAYGFRNPWRTAFDPATGALWGADVGQSSREEVDRIERGGNYGWDRLEGDTCYPPGSDCDPAGTILPLATYGHDDGCSVTGGVVYRGNALPALAGNYLYADYCSGNVWALPVDGGDPALVFEGQGDGVASFATDTSGEVYLLTHGGPILTVTAAE